MFAYFAYNFVIYTIILGLSYTTISLYEAEFDCEFSKLKPEEQFRLDLLCYFICKIILILTFAISLIISVLNALEMVLIILAVFL